MTYLYILSTDDRADYVASKALRAVRPNSGIDVVKFTGDNRLTDLLALIDADRVSIDHVCFATDGRDASAIADFNAFLRALRTRDREDGIYPAIVRSINIF